jgi:hypothetical protein
VPFEKPKSPPFSILSQEQVVIFQKARSATINKADKDALYEVQSILEHRRRKGKKGMEFRVQWIAHPPTWENEITLKEDVP